MNLHTGSAKGLLWFFAIGGSLLGAAPCGPAEEVKITIAVILATERNNVVDRDVKCVAEAVQKNYPNLTGFRLEKIAWESLSVGKSKKFALVDDEVATVLVRHGADSKNRVGLTMKAPLQGEIQYTTCCGKFFPIVTRYQTKDKEVLILAIRVQPCKK
jgi:hypothetical protein